MKSCKRHQMSLWLGRDRVDGGWLLRCRRSLGCIYIFRITLAGISKFPKPVTNHSECCTQFQNFRRSRHGFQDDLRSQEMQSDLMSTDRDEMSMEILGYPYVPIHVHRYPILQRHTSSARVLVHFWARRRVACRLGPFHSHSRFFD